LTKITYFDILSIQNVVYEEALVILPT
jgi:hypothetical protein